MKRAPTRTLRLVIAALAIAPRAFAQNDPVVAQALFDEAKELMHKGNWAAACPKLAESERLDPALGTLLNLGDCYENVGKTARAWATFREAEAIASREGQQARAHYAAGRAMLLESKLVRITIEVPPEARVPGLVVSRDQEAVNEPLWGTGVPVDPGEHVIEAHAPGYKNFVAHVVASHGPVVVRLAPLEIESSPPPPPVEPTPSSASPKTIAAPVALPTNPDVQTASSPMRTSGFVLGGVGLAGVGLGSIFGVLAIDRDNASLAAGCSATTCPTQNGINLTHDAATFATAANITFVVSAALLVTGVVFVLVAPRGAPARAVHALLSPWSFQ